jgi:hypothetical protein
MADFMSSVMRALRLMAALFGNSKKKAAGC